MLMVLWSVDTDDYEQPGVEVIVQRALEGVKPGRDHPDARRRRRPLADGRSAAGDHPRAARARLRLVTVPQLLARRPAARRASRCRTNLSGD